MTDNENNTENHTLFDKYKIDLKQSKNWCFTEHNTDNDFDLIWEENKDILTYLCWGVEVCPTTNKKHFQGWFQCKNKKRLTGVKKIFITAHLAACKGTELQNDEYCQKDGVYFIYGKYIKQGARCDLEQLKRLIDTGTPLIDIINAHFSLYCRYRNGIESYYNMRLSKSVPKWRNVKVYYIWGETGTGKTKYAFSMTDWKTEGYNLGHWNTYTNEQSILIDKYNNDIKINELLNLLDGYPLRLNCKFGFAHAMWTKVYITSNLSPDELHAHAKPRHRRALMRRLTVIKKMENNITNSA